MTNSEKFKTAEERDKAFGEFCKKIESCWVCPLAELGYKKKIRKCTFSWLDLEANEESNKEN